MPATGPICMVRCVSFSYDPDEEEYTVVFRSESRDAEFVRRFENWRDTWGFLVGGLYDLKLSVHGEE